METVDNTVVDAVQCGQEAGLRPAGTGRSGAVGYKTPDWGSLRSRHRIAGSIAPGRCLSSV